MPPVRTQVDGVRTLWEIIRVGLLRGRPGNPPCMHHEPETGEDDPVSFVHLIAPGVQRCSACGTTWRRA